MIHAQWLLLGVRAAEYLSLILAALNLAAAAWAASPGSAASGLKAPLLLSFGFCFVIALLIASQFNLLVRQLDPTQPTGGDLDGLSFKDLKRLLSRSPVLHRVVGALGIALFFVTLFSVGGVTWTTDSPFERRHAIGIALYVSALYAIATPILAALARLPSAPDELAQAFKASDT
jgi:hypothetical protein